MTTFPDLAIMADMLGVTLRKHDGGLAGYYDHEARTISTRRGMSPALYRSTLAHELAHAMYGDVATGHGHYDEKQEQRANRFAAKLLINQDTFAADFAWCQGNLQELADELEITQHLLGIYLRQHPLREKESTFFL